MRFKRLECIYFVFNFASSTNGNGLTVIFDMLTHLKTHSITYRTYRKTYRGACRCFIHLFFVFNFASSTNGNGGLTVLFDMLTHQAQADGAGRTP